jgi:Cys-rich protein (TIGR01571 family)
MTGDKIGGAEESYKEPAPRGYGAVPQTAAGGPPGYGAPPGYAQPQQHYAQPQAGFNAYAQQQQMPPPNAAYGVPPPTAGYGYQNQQAPVGAPPMVQGQMAMPPMGQWTTGLCDMGEDPTNCVVTFFLPCITFGQIAEVIDQGTTSCLVAGAVWVGVLLIFGCPCFVSCMWRTKLRAKYNLPQDGLGDLCTHFWCGPCALCQVCIIIAHSDFSDY